MSFGGRPLCLGGGWRMMSKVVDECSSARG
jgi:hypothetical protein